MTPLEAKQYLDSFINYELKPLIPYASSFKLERVTHLFNLIGNPQKSLKIIHVAGTKGKGSTCAFTASILESAGYKVGLYTSPHLNDDKERIRILGFREEDERVAFRGKIKESEFCRLLEGMKPYLETMREKEEGKHLSYFEVYTALALSYFHERQVDFAVLETGLGGRLDATNAVDSFICAITPISLEHTKQLGSTLAAIAKEKAAIIKNQNQLAVIAPQADEAMEVIKERCQEIGVRALLVDQDIHTEFIQENTSGQVFNIKGTIGEYTDLRTRLLGRYQLINAAVSVGIIESLSHLGFPVEAEAIKEGIQNTVWPGRFEIIRQNPPIVLDGAHNGESCRALAHAVQNIFPQRKIILILGLSGDKDKVGICRELNEVASEVVLTKANHPRAIDLIEKESKDLFRNKNVISSANVKEALKIALGRAKRHDVVLVAGSLFVVGEARELCINHN